MSVKHRSSCIDTGFPPVILNQLDDGSAWSSRYASHLAGSMVFTSSGEENEKCTKEQGHTRHIPITADHVQRMTTPLNSYPFVIYPSQSIHHSRSIMMDDTIDHYFRVGRTYKIILIIKLS